MKTKKMVTCSVFAALTFVATWIIKIPMMGTGGYVNIGDCMVVMCGIFLGPAYGAMAAGIGSCLVDIVSDYAIYAPATLIIKALMAFFVALLYKNAGKLNKTVLAVLCCFLAEMIMICGYFLFDAILYKSFLTALAGMPGNLLQAGFGLVCSVVLYKVLSKNKYISEQIKF